MTFASAIAPFWFVDSIDANTSSGRGTENAARCDAANLTAPMSEHRYDPRAIEPKWQAVWEREQTWQVSNDEVAGAAEVLRARDAARTRRASRTWGT